MRADLEWFRTFKAVYESGTMSNAAKELQISQPGVSLHLSSLEAYIGYPLFERNARRMTPTVQAQLLYQQLEEPLQKMAVVENSFRKKSGKTRITLSIGIYPGLFRQLLEAHITTLDCNIIMHLDNDERLSDMLESGAVDLIVTSKNIPKKNVVYQLLGQSQFVIVAGENTDITGFEQIYPDNKKGIKQWLQDQLWYSTAQSSYLNFFWKQNFGKEPEFSPNYIIPDKSSILNCLRKGTGLAFLPHSLCRNAIEKGEVKLLWTGFNEMKNTLYLGQKKNTLTLKPLQQIKEIIFTEFEKCH